MYKVAHFIGFSSTSFQTGCLQSIQPYRLVGSISSYTSCISTWNAWLIQTLKYIIISSVNFKRQAFFSYHQDKNVKYLSFFVYSIDWTKPKRILKQTHSFPTLLWLDNSVVCCMDKTLRLSPVGFLCNQWH